MISIKFQSHFIETTLWQRCSHVNLLHIFRTLFSKNISGELFRETTKPYNLFQSDKKQWKDKFQVCHGRWQCTIYIKMNFIKMTRLKLVKKNKNKLRAFWSSEFQKQKNKITKICISFKDLLVKEWLNAVKVIFYNVVGCFFGVYNFAILKSSILLKYYLSPMNLSSSYKPLT